MQKVKLPLTVDVERSAQKRLDYAGFYPRQQLTRLVESVVSVDRDVDAELSFDVDSQRLTTITGHAGVSVTLLCQRCEQLFSHVIHVTFCFSPIQNEHEADALPEGYEPVEVNEFGQVDLLRIIEDELILSLPIVPAHQLEYCEMSDADRVFGQLPEESDKPNPFAVLANLKRK